VFWGWITATAFRVFRVRPDPLFLVLKKVKKEEIHTEVTCVALKTRKNPVQRIITTVDL
jgi:hypothetical protein